MVQKPDGLRGERVWKRCKGGPWKDAGRMPGCVPFCMQACAQLHVARREHSTYLNTAATGLEMEEARLRWNVLHLAHCPGNRLRPAKHALSQPPSNSSAPCHIPHAAHLTLDDHVHSVYAKVLFLTSVCD